MKKEIALSEQQSYVDMIGKFIINAKRWVYTPCAWLRSYYSYVLSKEVSKRKANAITQLQLAFLLMVIPCSVSILIRLLAMVWLGVSILRVKD